MTDRPKRLSIESAGVEDLVMLDGTPDDSALDSVLLPAPAVPKQQQAAAAEQEATEAAPPGKNEVDLDLAAGLDHEGMDTAAYATAAVRARLDESADLDFRAPRDTAGHAVAAVMTRLEDAADEVPEAGALPREAAPSPQLDDVPEAGALPGELVVPAVGPQCGPTASPDPADAAASMGFTAVDAVDDEPGESPARPRRRSGGVHHVVVLVIGIICLLVAMVGLLWFKG